ncbi:MAG: CsbD family protein [Acidobacteria bacterium]|nr:CsbD family protein [Acidobacteriota bacterium]
MNSDQLQGKWKQVKGTVKERWGKLTDDDVDVVNGQSEQLIGKVQERYGIAKEEAQRQVDDWMRSGSESESADELKRRRAS